MAENDSESKSKNGGTNSEGRIEADVPRIQTRLAEGHVYWNGTDRSDLSIPLKAECGEEHNVRLGGEALGGLQSPCGRSNLTRWTGGTVTKGYLVPVKKE